MFALHYSHTLFRIYTSLSQLGGSEAKGKKARTSQIHSGERGKGEGGRATRWNGKIDHVSRLNNVSGTTADSRRGGSLCLLVFFFSPIALCRLSKSKEWVVVPCLHKKGGRGKEMRNMRRAGSNGGEKRRGENKDRETDWGRKKQKKGSWKNAAVSLPPGPGP